MGKKGKVKVLLKAWVLFWRL